MKQAFMIFLLILASASQFLALAQSDDISEQTFYFPANAEGWMSTGMTAKKGDCVMFKASGLISLGPWAGTTDATGTDNPFLAVYSRFGNFSHGALIAGNGDELMVARSKLGLIAHNELQLPSSGLGFLPDNFIGNIFVSKTDQDIQFFVNDADYANNYGHYTITVKIFKNIQAAEDEYLSVPACTNRQPAAYDVIIYRGANGQIIHSGLVTQVGPDGKVLEIESKWRERGLYRTAPDKTPYGAKWEIYHTDRSTGDDRNLLKISSSYGAYITDKGNMIKTPIFYIDEFFHIHVISFFSAVSTGFLKTYYYLAALLLPDLQNSTLIEMKDYGYNCHGFTFTGGDGWIDDGWPVQKILSDNNYCLVYTNP